MPHLTAQIADPLTEAAQETMLRLHSRPLTDDALPALPEHAPPPSVLEDDTDMRGMLKQSDEGSAAGPPGSGGNMLAIVVQSDICRMAIIVLLCTAERTRATCRTKHANYWPVGWCRCRSPAPTGAGRSRWASCSIG